MKEFTINTRDIWESLKIKRQYSKWIIHKIEKYNLKENIDYSIKQTISENQKDGRPKNDYYVSKEIALNFCRYCRNNIYVKNTIKKFNLDINKNIIIQETSRDEINFGVMLDKILNMNILKQYTIPNENDGFYRLDFYIPNTLIIEYDEIRHKYYTYEEQEGRQLYCQQWLAKNETNGYIVNCIRVKQGEELEGIHEIIKYINDMDIKIA